MNDLWRSRVDHAAAVTRAEQAIEAMTCEAEIAQAEQRWGRQWDGVHDLDDKIFAIQAGNVSEIAIKAKIWGLRGNEDTPYLHYGRSIERDVLALADASQ